MSVHLEALKKAALEKRTREESSGGGEVLATSAAGPQSLAVDAADEAVALAIKEPVPLKPVVATAAVDYVARQEANRNRRTFEEMEEVAERPVSTTGPEPATATPEPEADAEPGTGQENETESCDSVGGQWDAEDADDATEVVPEDFPEPEIATEDFSLPDQAAENLDLSGDASGSGELPAGDEHEEDLDLDLDASVAAEFDTPEKESAADQAPEVNPAAAAGVDQAQQRRAMQKLMGRSREVLQRSKRRGNYMHAALLVTSVVAIGLYYWVLSHSEGPAMPEPLVLSGQGEVTVQPTQADSTPADPAVVSSADALKPVVAVEEAVIATPSPDTPVENAPGPDAAPVAKEPVALVEPLREAVRESTESSSFRNSRVLIERRQTPRPVARKVNDAYRAYQRGDLDRASRLYREVLEESPRQRDALLGSAAIAVQRGQYQEALRYYQRRLADDSGDHFARAGLLALASQGVADPELQSEVKILLDDYPQQAHLHFLLGSLQAAARSWPEAQRSFFEARSWDRDDPDYAYNLAVSLEHLRQPAQALAQYRQALELAKLTTPQFDIGVASRRVVYLEARQP